MVHNILYIQSLQNPLIKQMVLLKQAKYRKESNLFVAEGVRTITTLTHTGLIPEYLFTTQEHEQLACSLAKPTTTVVSTTDAIIAKISALTTTAGLVAVFKKSVCTLDNVKAPGIVLAQITDPGNMGTLIRSAAAFNVKTVIVVEGVDPWSTKVVQASAGTIGMVNLFELSWQTLIQICAEKNILLNALVVDGKSAEQATLQNQLLVVGNEAHGLPKEWQKDCQLKTTIAMPGQTESLNVAVAGSIALYEMTKV